MQNTFANLTKSTGKLTLPCSWYCSAEHHSTAELWILIVQKVMNNYLTVTQIYINTVIRTLLQQLVHKEWYSGRSMLAD